jgi:DNA-binding transcriptional ArsR family regulator
VVTYQDAALDAIGDSTRRAILARLLHGPQPVVELARGLPVSRPAVSQHLRVLKDAHLVVDEPLGNRRVYALNPQAFGSLRDYFDHFWSQSLEAFKRRVEGADSPSPRPHRAARTPRHKRKEQKRGSHH